MSSNPYDVFPYLRGLGYSHGIVSRKITSAHERMVIMRRWSSSRYASQRITCLKLADDLVVAHMKMAYNAKLSSWLTRKLIEVFTNLCDQYCMDILSQAWHQHQAQVECSSQRYCVVDCWPSKRIHAQEWISGSYSIALLLFLSYRDPALLRGDQRGLVMDLLKSTIPNSIPLLSLYQKGEIQSQLIPQILWHSLYIFCTFHFGLSWVVIYVRILSFSIALK